MSYLLSTEALIDIIIENASAVAVAGALKADDIAISVISFAMLRASAHEIKDTVEHANWMEAIQQYEDRCFAMDSFRHVDIVVAREYSLLATVDMQDLNGVLVSAEDRLIIATAMAKSLVLIVRSHPWVSGLLKRGLQVKFY